MPIIKDFKALVLIFKTVKTPLTVRVYILGSAALATSSQALSVFLAIWRRGGGPRYTNY